MCAYSMYVYMYVCLNLTFFCFSLLPLKHLLLWRQSLLQELHVKLILLLHFLLLPEAHLITYIALEAETQCDHWVANATDVDTRSTVISSLFGQSLSTDWIKETLLQKCMHNSSLEYDNSPTPQHNIG